MQIIHRCHVHVLCVPAAAVDRIFSQQIRHSGLLVVTPQADRLSIAHNLHQLQEVLLHANEQAKLFQNAVNRCTLQLDAYISFTIRA